MFAKKRKLETQTIGDKQIDTKFEDLPNDIFICCFEYLNAPDIFYAFEHLNLRFYRLIRTFPLRLNFEDINKVIFDRFCEKMFDYTEIQQHIYSIKLSNKQTHGQIQAFFTYFSLVEFTQLRSLTLIELNTNNTEQLSSILPLLTQLTCLRLIPSLTNFDALTSQLPKLSSQEMIPLTKFTVRFCMFNDIYQLLLHMPFLQCLNILQGTQLASMSSTEISRFHGHMNHLKHLTVSDAIIFNIDNLMDTIAHMINLRSLIISTVEKSDIIDASRWQQLITSSLPRLTVFRFKFSSRNRNEILQKYKEFQSDFWIKEHNWYTECLLTDSYDSYIFTIPYLNSIKPMCFLIYDRHFNILVDNSKTFDTVTGLHILNGELKSSSDFYFRNVTSLIIDCLPAVINNADEQTFIRSLKRIIDLSKLKHLKIPISARTIGSTILLEILKKASGLSSLDIQQCAVDLLKMNNELCQYTSKKIKKLKFSSFVDSYPCDKQRLIKSIPEVFENIEQINYSMLEESESCLFLLQNLPQLSRLTMNFYHREESGSFGEVKKELSKLKNIFFYEEILRVQGQGKLMGFGFWVARGYINP